MVTGLIKLAFSEAYDRQQGGLVEWNLNELKKNYFKNRFKN